MLARIARRASNSPLVSRAAFARHESSFTSLLQREIEEEKGNCFEGDDLTELQSKISKTFSLEEASGNMNVALRGNVGGNDVHIRFDVQDVMEEMDEEEEEDMYEEEGEGSDDDEEDQLPGIRFIVDIKNNNKGLQVDAVATSNVTIQRVRFVSDFKEDESEAMNAPTSKMQSYLGPNFEDLELDLQEKFYHYLEEHKVDDDVAQFISQYSDFKEQREYLGFLENVHGFVKK